MRNPTTYTLQEVMEWKEFETLCTSILYGMGFQDIKSAGGTKDKGRDAAVFTSDGGTIVIQVSQEKEPLKESKPGSKTKSKFWREYDRWKKDTKVKKFIFLSNRSLGNKKIELINKLKKPPVDMFGVEELVNYLDYDDTGKDIKKQFAIFSKDLEEIFGAENRDEKLNDIAKVIDDDENYNITTILATTQDKPPINGTVFSSQHGDVTHYYVPKSPEHFKRAIPTVSVTLAVPNTEEGHTKLDTYRNAIMSGESAVIPPEMVKDFTFKLGERVLMDNSSETIQLRLGPAKITDNKPRVLMIRAVSDPTIVAKSSLKIVKQSRKAITMNNHDAQEPLDIEMTIDTSGKVQFHYGFHLDRCRDVAQAYEYARIFNAIQQDSCEIIFDDDGIERKIVDIDARGGEPLSEGYMRGLHDTARIQQFFKVRLPNPFRDDIELTDNDYWSIARLIELIDNGQAEVDINNLEFAMDTERIRSVAKDDDEIYQTMAIGGVELKFLSIMGVRNFGNLRLILPEVKLRIQDQDGGISHVQVETLKKPYIQQSEQDFDQPAAEWS